MDILGTTTLDACVVAKLVILVLLLIVLYKVTMQHENFNALSYTSGANQRIMMQEFSGTNQQQYETGYNRQKLSAGYADRNREHMSSPADRSQEEILAAQLYS